LAAGDQYLYLEEKITKRLITTTKREFIPTGKIFFYRVPLKEPKFKPQAARQVQGQENIYEKSDPNRVFNREN
jgi:hypothetical protein